MNWKDWFAAPADAVAYSIAAGPHEDHIAWLCAAKAQDADAFIEAWAYSPIHPQAEC
jgi:hypothetical protein